MTQKEAIQNILSAPLKQCPVNPVQYNASTICRFYNKDYGCVCSNKSGYIANKWDYSTTTSKYRNRFLDETTKETRAKIASGKYILADLNKAF